MALFLLHRTALAIRCEHPSLPLTSLRLQQQRRIDAPFCPRNATRICSIHRSSSFFDASYGDELEIVEQRRQKLDDLLESCSEESWRKRRDIEIELDWLCVLEDVISFFYEEG